MRGGIDDDRGVVITIYHPSIQERILCHHANYRKEVILGRMEYESNIILGDDDLGDDMILRNVGGRARDRRDER